MKRHRLFVAVNAVLVVAALLAAGIAIERRMIQSNGDPDVLKDSMAKDYGEVPPFLLTNQSGKTVSNKDLLGRPWVASFIFTRCSDQCPLIVARMKGLQRRERGLKLVSFSVDPSDTPEALSEYRKSQGASWLFMTGKPGEVQRLSTEGFHLAAAVSPDAIMHSEKLVLVDARGKILGYYDGTNPAEVDRLAERARSLAVQ